MNYDISINIAIWPPPSTNSWLCPGLACSKNSLPIKQNLKSQHIPMDETCTLCDDYQETLMNYLWLCDHAEFVWKLDPGFNVLYQKRYRSFMDLVEVMLQQGSSFHIALFSTIPWCLWQQRNRLREHQPSWPLHEIGARAKDLVMEYFKVHKQAP